MIITEQLYAILPASMTSSIDWNETYQTPATARFNVSGSLFVISKPYYSEYLPNQNWMNVRQAYEIVDDESFSGPRQPITGSI